MTWLLVPGGHTPPMRINTGLETGEWRSRASAILVNCRGSSSTKGMSRSQSKREDGGESWILDNAGVLRSAPLFVGSASFVAVLLNRSFSGIAAVADASSAQSRADVLAVALSATVVLTGLVWKSIEPKPQFPVALDGIECMRIAKGLPAEVERELTWAWEALAGATNTVSLVVVYRKACVLQAGLAAKSSEEGTPVPVDVIRLLQGSLFKGIQTSNKQLYLANLALFPGRFELPFLPANTQAVIIQPLGQDGLVIVGSDTLRGFGPSDQGWIAAVGEKLDSTLADVVSSEEVENVPSSELVEKTIGNLPSR